MTPMDHLREAAAFAAVILLVTGLLAWADIAAYILQSI